MSIAWGSLVLLIVLLPGVLFFIGILWPEQFTREAELRSPLGQLAGALLVAFFVHGLSFSILTGVCGSVVPCISMSALFGTIQLDTSPASTIQTSRMFEEFRWWIFIYVMGTSASGMGLGALYGWLIATRRIRRFSKHNWIFDLSVDGLTYAYVLSHIRENSNILMYKGFLRAFGLQQDGKFSYIVLSDVTRMYMTLSSDDSRTSAAHLQRVIGASSPGEVVLPTEPTKPKKRKQSLFVIEGEDIANAVFDVLATEAKPLKPDAFRSLVMEEAKAAGLKFSDEDLREIFGDD